MIRTLSLAALVAASIAMPAFANDETADAAAAAQFTQQLASEANASQVRNLLQAQGYTKVSNLAQDEKGRWIGSAIKGGKSVGIAVAFPVKRDVAPSTN